jgi:hypothetical protein
MLVTSKLIFNIYEILTVPHDRKKCSIFEKSTGKKGVWRTIIKDTSLHLYRSLTPTKAFLFAKTKQK